MVQIDLGFFIRRGWTERECLDLAIGLQKYGISETKQIAELIRTKKEIQVKNVLLSQLCILKKHHHNVNSLYKDGGAKSHGTITIPEEVKSWADVRKWHVIAMNQIDPNNKMKSIDYSKAIIHDVWQTFYEEAEETTNPQVVDVKAIYKFILDCLSGKNPAELMPKESAIVLLLIKKLKEIQKTMNLDEEKKFISSFKKATSFVSLNLDDEVSGENEDSVTDDPSAVCIPHEVLTNLRRHHKLVQSFNPLMLPIWLLDKEQTLLSQMMRSTT